MRAILKEITIENFMGIEHFFGKFKDGENLIEAANGTGKSTCLLHAPNWCMFGTDGYGDSKFRMKPVGTVKNGMPLGERIPNLHTSVELVYDINGEEVKLGKTATDEFTGKDEYGEKKFKGDKFKYFIDEIEVKATEFKAKVDAMFNSEYLQILSQTNHFMNLHWEKQREFLLKMTPDITDLFVLETLKDEKFSFMQPFLDKGIKPEDVKKRAKDALTKTESERDGKTPAIVENSRKLLDIDFAEIKQNMALYEAEIASIEESEINPAKLVAQNNELRKKIEDEIDSLNKELVEVKRSIKKEVNGAIEEKIEEKNKLETEIAKSKKIIADIKEQISELERDINRKSDELAQAATNYKNAKAKEFNAGEPTCSHGFKACSALIEQFETNKFEQAELFKTSKETELKIIKEKGDRINDEKSKLETTLKLQRDNLLSNQYVLDTRLDILADYKDETPKEIDFNQYESVKKLSKAISEATESLNQFSVSAAPDNARKKELSELIVKAKIELSKEKDNAELKARIKELEKEKLNLSDEAMKLRRQIIAVEDFVSEKMKMVENSVNGMFSKIKFRLFEMNGSGNIENKCVCMLEGVPYSAASYSQRANIGLDFIRTASKFLDTYYPVSIDNRESITNIPEMETQIFNLKVNSECKTINVC